MAILLSLRAAQGALAASRQGGGYAASRLGASKRRTREERPRCSAATWDPDGQEAPPRGLPES